MVEPCPCRFGATERWRVSLNKQRPFQPVSPVLSGSKEKDSLDAEVDCLWAASVGPRLQLGNYRERSYAAVVPVLDLVLTQSEATILVQQNGWSLGIPRETRTQFCLGSLTWDI